jgi:GH25 family lysozyme M1 (1,4-beta-N-acetylmuramidase)
VNLVPARGIDIFRIYQNVQDWRAVRNSGVEYCWAKATNGTRIAFNNDAARTPAPADPTVAGARSVGIAPGLYGYALPGDPIAQADVLANEVIRLGCRGPGTLPPALDLEEPGTKSTDFGVRFLRRLQERIGQQRVAIYMSASWAAELRPDTWNVPGLIIWIAAYGSNNGTRGPIPYYFGRTDVHQFTSVGLHLVRGISSSGLDVNEADIALSTLLGGEDDDMFTDNDRAKLDRLNAFLAESANAPGGQTVHDAIWRNGDALAQLLANQSAQNEVLAQVAQNPEITADALGDRIDTAVTRATAGLAEELTNRLSAQLLAQVGPAVLSVVGEDNAEQADRVVQELARRLNEGGPQTTG